MGRDLDIIGIVDSSSSEQRKRLETVLRGVLSGKGPGQKIGTESSGNYGHEGRPGEVGGSGPGGREMSETTVVDGKRMAADGSPLPDHIQATYIPPAWTDVKYNPDPNGDLLVKGKDAAGRDQYLYSKRFTETQAAEKFARIKELDEKFDKITKENETNRSDANPAVRENANCMKLIMETGIRPGSDEDTKAKIAAYGATTLKGSHIVQVGGNIELQFVGKKGVALTIPVDDQGTAKMLLARVAKVGPEGRIFNTNRASLLEYSHRLDGGKFKTKDFRTYLGTSLAVKEMKNHDVPKTMKEYKKAVRDVAKVVAKKLGNTATVALQSYISPVVFSPWRLA
jgi:DNA topoisomerase-1